MADPLVPRDGLAGTRPAFRQTCDDEQPDQPPGISGEKGENGPDPAALARSEAPRDVSQRPLRGAEKSDARQSKGEETAESGTVAMDSTSNPQPSRQPGPASAATEAGAKLGDPPGEQVGGHTGRQLEPDGKGLNPGQKGPVQPTDSGT